MRSRFFQLRILLFSLLVLGVTLATAAASPANNKSTRPARATTDFAGTWTGTFFSKHENVAAFTMTVVITPDSQGRLIGASTLDSECLKNLRLEVTVKGSEITLAGSDDDGDNITVRGTADATGSIVKASYILNGSASGRCETDGGTGNLAKR